jgi:F0F1-type ATP synthase assembly protein I
LYNKQEGCQRKAGALQSGTRQLLSAGYGPTDGPPVADAGPLRLLALAREVAELKDEKPGKREESPWVTVARYSEIGFMIPMAVVVGYFLGRMADYFLHTHWIYLLGIIFGAVAGFVSMIRQALESSKEEDRREKEDRDGSHDGQ